MLADLSSLHGVCAFISWPKLFEEHRVQYVVLNTRRDHELLDHLRSYGGWEIRWKVGATLLLARSTPQSRDGASL